MNIVAIILAAGEGRRAGGFKPLWFIDKKRVIDRVIKSASVQCSEIRVVGGYHFSELKSHITANWPGIKVLFNDKWKKGGMFSSIKRGLKGLACPVFIHPADIPGPGSEVYSVLAAVYEKNPREVIRPIFRDRAGHPILLSPSTILAVQQAGDNTNLREVLSNFRKFDVAVNTDLILHDFDTKEQFEVLKKKLRFQVV
jgi:CTP:molybdopterin cytidylyltransferase MocA